MLPKAAFLFPPLLAVESTYEGVRSSVLGEFLVQAAAAMVLLLLVWNLIDKLRGGTPQKREVSFAEEIVTQDELKQAHGRITRERDEIDNAIAELKEEQRAQRERHDAEISQLNARIDSVPGRVISLLRETKGLI